MMISYILQIGQEVVVGDRNMRWNGNPYRILTVEKLTPTQATLSDGKKYSLRTGAEIGRSGHEDFISTLYPEDARIRNKEIDANNMRMGIIGELHHIAWKSLTDDQRIRIWAIVHEENKDVGLEG